MSATKKTAREISKCIGKLVALLLLLNCVGMALCAEMDAETRPPNVVLFIMDDVGMGDIGCFGNHTIKTPNIDGLARDGARLTQHMAFPMCTPSRAALMTGRLPVRYGFGSKQKIRVFLFPSSRGGLPSNETTIAELLKGSGYATALIGKWHLGISCAEANSCSDPNSQGFDYFYGLPVTNFRDCGTENTVPASKWDVNRNVTLSEMLASLAVACVIGFLLVWTKLVGIKGFVFFMVVVLAGNIFFACQEDIRSSCVLMENRSIVEQPLRLYDHLTERLHGRAIQFVEQNQNQQFLLVMSFVQAHTALFNNKEFRNHSAHGQYGDNVEEMDWSVGEVLKTLKRLGLEEKTFVYLTSDNGGHVEEFTDAGERHGGWNGVYKGGKTNTWDGGIRVPTIVKFPGHIPADSVVSQPTHLSDVLPTVARVTGAQLPDDRVYDGRDMMPLLTPHAAEKEEILHEFMFHYCGGFINAVRYTPKDGDTTYKLHYATSHLIPGVHGVMGCFDVFACECKGNSVDRHDPPLVYDISNDPSEVNPLDSNDPKVGNVIRKVNEAVTTHRESLPQNTDHQFTPLNTMPRPWERPRCGRFPYYSCTDPHLDLLKKLKGEN